MAKLLVLVIGVAMFAAIALLIWFLANRFERAGERQAAPASLWRPVESESADGRRVELEHVTTAEPAEVLETRPVGVVAPDEADGAARLADLRELAQDRARTLNAQARRR